jgi:hypothetical protein
MVEERRAEEWMKKHVIAIVVVFLSAITCGATFLSALYRQFALAEVAASLATGVQLYFLSSSIGDLLEDKKEPNRLRLVSAVGIAAALLLYVLVKRYLGAPGGR